MDLAFAPGFGAGAGVDLGKFGGEFFQIGLGQIFEVDEIVARFGEAADEFIELEMHGFGVAVLRALDQEDHDEGDDGRAAIDDELPRIREVEKRTGDQPDDHHSKREAEGPDGTDSFGGPAGEDFTGLNLTGSLFEIDEVTGEKFLNIKNLILPAFTLGIRPLAIITQLTRSSMLDVLNQDYIRTAYAKGLNKRTVIFKHALRNALNPVITAITGWFAELLAGAFFIEYIFGWKGIGKITVDALEKLDYPLVMGAVLFSACFFIIINFTADLLYKKIDPRIGVN